MPRGSLRSLLLLLLLLLLVLILRALILILVDLRGERICIGRDRPFDCLVDLWSLKVSRELWEKLSRSGILMSFVLK